MEILFWICYLWGSCKRISPEAPVQIVNIDYETKVLGGAGNVINNLKSLGSKVDIISVIGECQSSKELISLLNQININTNFLVHQKDRISSKKSRIVAEKQQVVRYDIENTDDISNDSQKAVISIFKKNCKKL